MKFLLDVFQTLLCEVVGDVINGHGGFVGKRFAFDGPATLL